MFLPAGYPHSVTSDYLEYQIYDSLQAFSSSIAGLLSSRAVLEGVGVGDATASTTSAVLLSILQESLGRVTTILFAHRLGTSLEPECKMYRLLADIFNDTAMVLECLSPAFPKPIRVSILASSSALKALCGVAAGSSKASLSAHFARWGNLGELNAKDSSQETVISLLGMLAGSVVVSWIRTPVATWTTLMLLLSIHLGMNYRAVKAVQMRTLNRQRANIVFANLIAYDKVLTPAEVSEKERVFEWDGVLRDVTDRILGHCRVGVTMAELLDQLGSGHDTTGSKQVKEKTLSALLDIYGGTDCQHLNWLDTSSRQVWIVLKKGCTTSGQLEAWYNGLYAMHMIYRREEVNARKLVELEPTEIERSLSVLTATKGRIDSVFAGTCERLERAGWDLETAALETRSGTRIDMQDH